MYRNFEEIVTKAKEIGPRKVAVLYPHDPDVMRAMADGMKEGLIDPVLVGNLSHITGVAREVNVSLGNIELVDRSDPQEAADLCLDMVAKGEVDFVVKGEILTSYLYRALIRKTKELAPDQKPCTLCFHQAQDLDRIFIITDPGVNIRPDLECKKKILVNGASMMRRLGCDRPKVMVLAACRPDGAESNFARDATELRRLAEGGEMGECELCRAQNLYEAFPDGSINVDTFPDIFLVPNLETGNILCKSIDHLLLGIRQCATVGAGLITLTPSRSDEYQARMTNLCLGLVLAASGEG